MKVAEHFGIVVQTLHGLFSQLLIFHLFVEFLCNIHTWIAQLENSKKLVKRRSVLEKSSALWNRLKILDLKIKLWSILVNSCDMWSCQLKLLRLKSILTYYVAFVLICCMNPIGLILVSTYFANPACADSAVSGLSNALYVDKALMAAMPTEVINTSLTIFFEDINYFVILF